MDLPSTKGNWSTENGLLRKSQCGISYDVGQVLSFFFFLTLWTPGTEGIRRRGRVWHTGLVALIADKLVFGDNLVGKKIVGCVTVKERTVCLL